MLCIINNILNDAVEFIKNIWKSLMDSYRRNKKKISKNIPSSHAGLDEDISMTRWHLYEEMLFADDSTIARKSRSSENTQKSYYTYFIYGYLC